MCDKIGKIILTAISMTVALLGFFIIDSSIVIPVLMMTILYSIFEFAFKKFIFQIVSLTILVVDFLCLLPSAASLTAVVTKNMGLSVFEYLPCTFMLLLVGIKFLFILYQIISMARNKGKKHKDVVQ